MWGCVVGWVEECVGGGWVWLWWFCEVCFFLKDEAVMGVFCRFGWVGFVLQGEVCMADLVGSPVLG